MAEKGLFVPVSSLVYSIAVVFAVATFFWFGPDHSGAVERTANKTERVSPTAAFPANGGSLGAIPDSDDLSQTCQGNSTVSRSVTFDVSGLTGTVSDVSVDFSASHTYLQDLEVTLIAPGGMPSHLLFAATGTTDTAVGSCDGSFADLLSTNTYTFSDAAIDNWWSNATGTTVPTSTNRTVVTGIGGAASPPPTTSLNATFGGMSAAEANGTWTLKFRDQGQGDTGSVTASNLYIATSAAQGNTSLDFDGDGTTDFVLTRDLNPPMFRADGLTPPMRFESVRERLKYEAENRVKQRASESAALAAPPAVGTNMAWFISNSQDGSVTGKLFGEPSTDWFTPADYNGDGMTDIAVWRPIGSGQASENAFYYILESGTDTMTTIDFGQSGDDPSVVGDYDADGKADAAVFRCPQIGSGAGQCYFFFKGSNGNPSGAITYVPWGFGEDGDFYSNPGDFDGDGRFDFCLQRANPLNANKGQFVLYRSMDGGVEYINFGNVDDIIVPGDYDADGRYDIAVSRTESINGLSGRSYYILERDGGGTGATPIRWGIAGDIRAPGDYDGDGATDIAIWRPNSQNPDANYFWVRQSNNGTLKVFEFGQCPLPGIDCDIPVANWNVH